MEINKVKIVVAEDDIAMRNIVIHKLKNNGFQVFEAENGRVAYDLVVKEKPNLLLMDLMMPEMDGFALLEKIRSSKEEVISQTPIIVLSNLWSNQDMLKVESFGVKAFMVKAYFTPDDIYGKIKEVLHI